MRMLSTLILCLFSLVCQAEIQVSIEGPDNVDCGDLLELKVVPTTNLKATWLLANSDKKFKAFDNNTSIVFASGRPGSYQFIAAVTDGKDIKILTKTVKIGSTVEPVVEPIQDLTFLITEETDQRHTLSVGQLSIFTNHEFRQKLSQFGSWRIYDQNRDLSDEPKFKELFDSNSKMTPPYITVKAGSKIVRYPLPASQQDLLTLLEDIKNGK